MRSTAPSLWSAVLCGRSIRKSPSPILDGSACASPFGFLVCCPATSWLALPRRRPARWVWLALSRRFAVSHENVRRGVNHFGPLIATDLRKRRPKPHTTWHLDEVYLKIAGRMVYLWRAVDAEGEVLDVLVQSRRNKRAALKLMRKLLKKYGFVP